LYSDGSFGARLSLSSVMRLPIRRSPVPKYD
jgi:hypothetical protein